MNTIEAAPQGGDKLINIDPAALEFFIRFAQESIDYVWRPPAQAEMESQKERKT